MKQLLSLVTPKSKKELLPPHLVFKLKEIVEFCDNYGQQGKEIAFIGSKQAQLNQRQREEEKVMHAKKGVIEDGVKRPS